MRTASLLSMLLAAACLPAGVARAQDAICVRCTGPEATYRCSLVDGPSRATKGAELLCITRLARDGHHDTCAVSRTAVTSCEGEERRISPTAGTDPLAAPPSSPPQVATPAEPASPPAVPPARAPGQPDDPQPARTVESLAKSVAKGSGEQISKAGAAIGEAARKSWNCMTSLFKSC